MTTRCVVTSALKQLKQHPFMACQIGLFRGLGLLGPDPVGLPGGLGLLGPNPVGLPGGLGLLGPNRVGLPGELGLLGPNPVGLASGLGLLGPNPIGLWFGLGLLGPKPKLDSGSLALRLDSGLDSDLVCFLASCRFRLALRRKSGPRIALPAHRLH
jgi:hypothetical protein